MKHFADFPHSHQEMAMTEAALRAYLLGKLTESEMELVDARLIDDADLFNQMESAEDDLFDAYARGRLDVAEQALFLERFGADQARRQFAHAFVKRTPSGRVVPFVRRPWVGIAIAASLLLVVGALMTPRGVNAPGTDAISVPVSAVPQSSPVATVVATPAIPITSVVSLALGNSRAAGAPTRAEIARDAQQVDLRIRLNAADRFAIYAIELRSQSDNIVWGHSSLTAATEQGELVLHAMVPADRIPAGTYELSVRGGATAAAFEDLGFTSLELRRVQ